MRLNFNVDNLSLFGRKFKRQTTHEIYAKLPSFAGAPPTIRVFATFECPQPSWGVRGRPLMLAMTCEFMSPSRLNRCIETN